MVPCAFPPDIAGMHERLMTFEEFRLSHHDALRTQREHLRDDAHADDILREAAATKGWAEWPNTNGS